MTIGRILALVIALGYAVAMLVHAGGITAAVVRGCLVLLLPFALIWFPDELGSFKGNIGRGGNINTETPPMLVSIAGWFILIGLSVVSYFLSCRGRVRGKKLSQWKHS